MNHSASCRIDLLSRRFNINATGILRGILGIITSRALQGYPRFYHHYGPNSRRRVIQPREAVYSRMFYEV